MTYTVGGEIQANDYNTFVQGGVSVNHSIANLNSIWGVGFGDRGYGQSGLLSTVTAPNSVTATQWATLIARLNAIQTHQTGSATGLTAPVAGEPIAFSSALSNFVSSAYSNRSLAGIQGTDSTVSTTNHTWNVLAPTTFQIVRTFTFPDADSARYFFNAGGRLALAFNAVDSLANLKGANWVSFLNTTLGSFNLLGKTSARTGTGGSVTAQAANTGYWALSTTDTTLLAISSGLSGAYATNTIAIKARTNGTQGSNGDNGTVITLTIDLNDVVSDVSLGNNINLVIGINATARRPETSTLPTAIPYPVLVPIVYTVTPSANSVNEGGTITFTVAAPSAPNGTVLYWTATTASTAGSSDFTDGAVNGAVTINNGAATFTRTLVNDVLAEGSETIAYNLRTSSITGTVVATSSVVTINDTSTPGFNFTTTIGSTTTNYNLRSAAIAAGWNQATPLLATVTIADGVVVGSTSTGAYAFDTGSGFPSGSSLALVIGSGAYIVGAGGTGGSSPYASGWNYGTSGGPALIAQAAITITNNGVIGGGGGGGGSADGETFQFKEDPPAYFYGAPGGGGAGYYAGSGGSGPYGNGGSASLTSGGAGAYGDANSQYPSSGGAGGALGASGNSGVYGTFAASGPGVAIGNTSAGGAAVTGNANINWAATGTRLGAIN